jgi:hypothetical protein
MSPSRALLPPTRPPPPEISTTSTSPLSYEAISELICWQSKSSHNPVTFKRSHLWTLLHWGSSLQYMSFWETIKSKPWQASMRKI